MGTHRRTAALTASLALLAAAPAAAAPSDLDAAFAGGGVLTTPFGPGSEFATEIVADAQDRLVLAAGGDGLVLARFGADGAPDLSFGGGDGFVDATTNPGYEELSSVAVLPDGRIVAAGISALNAGDMRLVAVRLLQDGSPDPAFDGDGNADGVVVHDLPGSTREGLTDLELLDDGSFWAAGSYRTAGDDQHLLVRFAADGSLDPGFDGDGWAVRVVPGDDFEPRGLGRLSDGRLVTAGYIDTRGFLARFTAAGAPDGEVTVVDGGFEELAVRDDRVVAVGYREGDGGAFLADVTRFTADGSLDPAFGTGGRVALDVPGGTADGAEDVLFERSGRIVLTGTTRQGAARRAYVARLQRDGAPDTSFAPDGIRALELPGTGWALGEDLAVQASGRLVTAVNRTPNAGDSYVSLVGLAGSPPDTDDDGVPDASDPCPAVAGACPPAGGAQSPAPQGATPPGLDRTAPVLGRLSLLRRSFAVGRRSTAFRFSLSERATVTITIAACRARKGCRPGKRAGTITRTLQPGAQRIVFRGRLGRRTLRRGRYVARVVAVDAAGNRSLARTATFRVVRR